MTSCVDDSMTLLGVPASGAPYKCSAVSGVHCIAINLHFNQIDIYSNNVKSEDIKNRNSSITDNTKYTDNRP